jgi:hypothetical protein
MYLTVRVIGPPSVGSRLLDPLPIGAAPTHLG